MTIKLRTRKEQQEKDEHRKKIEKKLNDLFSEQAEINNKIKKVRKYIAKLNDADAKEFIKSLPKQYSKYTKKQWEWILDYGKSDGVGSKVRYNFCKDLYWKLGFISFGYNNETKQNILQIPSKINKKTMVKSFNIIKKHLIEFESTKSNNDGELITGVYLQGFVNSQLVDIFYRKKEKDIIVHLGYKIKTMKNFSELLDWILLKNNEEDD